MKSERDKKEENGNKTRTKIMKIKLRNRETKPVRNKVKKLSEN